MEDRLQKVLAHAGVASRRKCEELILSGKVKVNGEIVQELGTKVNPEDKVEVSGKPLDQAEEKVYLLVNKPVGYVSTVYDPQRRTKVTDLVKKDVQARVYPVGRLDVDTEGLILLTNDGDLTYRMTHPKHEFPKTYIAKVQGVPTQDKLERFQKGLRLTDGQTAPAKIKRLKKVGNSTLLEITIYEGRNRQIRRMCETIGHPVLELKRVQVGFLTLEGVETGKFRELTKEEISQLKRSLSDQKEKKVRSTIKTGPKAGPTIKTGQKSRPTIKTGQKSRPTIKTGQKTRSTINTGQKARPTVNRGQKARPTNKNRQKG